MAKIDPTREENIRRWPVIVARLFNRIVGWTTDYCSGGCGYPVTGAFNVTIDSIDDVPVLMLLCSLDGPCYHTVVTHPTDSRGHRYSDIRPALVQSHRESDPKPDQIVLSFSR